MKKTTATTALAATIGLSAWTMTAALAVAPTEAPAEPAPVTAPAEAAPAPAPAAEQPVAEQAPAPAAEAPAAEGAAPEEVVIPDWSRDLDNSVSCADAVGTPYMDNVLKPGLPPVLDADGDGIMCESNGDDDAARAVSLDPWEGAAPPLPAGYVYPNCDTAYDLGLAYAAPVSLPFFGAHLDPDGDGMACETNGDDDAAFTGVVHEAPLAVDTPAPAPVAPGAAAPADQAPAAQAPAAEAPAAAEKSQVEEVPVGGADTGASGSQGRTALFAGGGALAALVGAGLLARRARQH
ncbi:excalibur calcium-binding domain-containing protein [Kocuria palustris]|uniref:excalibur calcium-binding domain-containing protein n=1 Tax=Kocuria palustris TaxID=71999 RepID=UPI0011A3A507|nr:excalibur calcium-binding domain-containing protein [Kocuria palustris]